MNDNFIIPALSERKSFVIDTGGLRAPKGIQTRLDSLQQLKVLKNGNEIASFMHEHSIKWYVIDPIAPVQWSDQTTLSHVVFNCGGYKVYHF